MKVCEYCAEDIQSEAIVCPHCRHKVGLPVGRVVITSILLLLLFVCSLPTHSDDQETSNLILKAHRACEMQTGHECSVP